MRDLLLTLLHDADGLLYFFLVSFACDEFFQLFCILGLASLYHGSADTLVDRSLAFLHDFPLLHQHLELSLVRSSQGIQFTLLLLLYNSVKSL